MIEQVLHQLRTQSVDRGCLGRALADDVQALQIGSRWEGRVIFVLFSPSVEGALAVVKIDHHRTHRLRLLAEWDALNELGGRPALLGRVPAPLAINANESRLVVVETAVEGTPVIVRMRRRAHHGTRSTVRDHLELTDWLTALQGSAPPAASVPLEADRIVDLANQALPADVATRTRFLADLRARARSLDGLALPIVPSHGDLHPSNLRSAGGQVNVIDWEDGLGQRSPLVDLVIFLTFYARAVRGRGRPAASVVEAFRMAFCSSGWLGRVSVGTLGRELRRHGLPPEAGGPLLAMTLAELADGETLTRSPRARTVWRQALAAYAADSNMNDG